MEGSKTQKIQALVKNETSVLIDLPFGKKALGYRWVYNVKYNFERIIECYKAHLVIFRNHQVEGIDYTETFAPVAKMAAVQVFLTVAAAKN